MNSELVAPPRTLSKSGAFPEKAYPIIAGEGRFQHLLALERKRTERTGTPFVLAILDISRLHESDPSRIVSEICATIHPVTRDTDLYGWYQYPSSLGLIFTPLRVTDQSAVQSALARKTYRALCKALRPADANKVSISCHFFPETAQGSRSAFPSDEKLYRDLMRSEPSRSFPTYPKRAADIVGALAGLILLSPLLPVIAMLIKFSSKGPVLYKQRRLGRFGKEFDFFKFRTMYVHTDHRIHEEYVRKFIDNHKGIAGEAGALQPVYKLTHDPRITPVGRFLRKSSLDEVPQFMNVLRGEMSLVGPRPPIPYEVVAYQPWHRRRLLEVKPGITGLWQVCGRSSTTFDEMVRLDLRYLREQSFWLDLKIILKTPRAILSGRGAY